MWLEARIDQTPPTRDLVSAARVLALTGGLDRKVVYLHDDHLGSIAAVSGEKTRRSIFDTTLSGSESLPAALRWRWRLAT